MKQDWSFQVDCVDRVVDALKTHKKVCLSSPTGTGKSQMMCDLILRNLQSGVRTVVYTDRLTLHQQLYRTLAGQGYSVSAIGGDVGFKTNWDAHVQVAMVLTANGNAKEFTKNRRDQIARCYPFAIIDEAHRMKTAAIRDMQNRHVHNGGRVLGVTATPTNLSQLYTKLVLGPSPLESEQRGVIVPVDIYAPSEISMAGIKVGPKGEWVESEVEKRLQKYAGMILGDVIEHYHKLNKYQLPTVCFAPSVATSVWMAGVLNEAGIRAEHVDGTTPQQERKEIYDRWRSRQTRVVCNCNILREGFDFRELRHLICLTPYRQISNWIQVAGRIRRAMSGKNHATIQDHVGNYFRHPGAMYYHDWDLQDTDPVVTEKIKKKKESLGERESVEIRCVECSLTWTPSREQQCCPGCGNTQQKANKRIPGTKGQLVIVDIKPEVVKSDYKLMEDAIYMCGHSGRTVGTVYSIVSRTIGRPVTTHVIRKSKPSDNKKLAREFWSEMFKNKPAVKERSLGDTEDHSS